MFILSPVLALLSFATLQSDPCNPNELWTDAGIVEGNGGLGAYGVALSVDTAFVGAPLDRLGYQTAIPGSLAIFEQTGTGWIFRQKVFPPDGPWNWRFGETCAATDGFLVVGAPGGRAAYVFERGANGYYFDAKLTPPATYSWDYGWSVDIDGEVITVAAPSCSNTDASFVFVYRRSFGSWLLETSLSWTYADYICKREMQVTISGDRIAVIPAQDPSKDARLFQWNGSQWTLDTEIDWPQYSAVSIDISGSSVILGGFERASIFSRSGSGWQQSADLQPPTPGSFGSSVAIDGSVCLVTNPGESIGYSHGTAYLFEDLGQGWNQIRKFATIDDEPGFAIGAWGVDLSDGGLVVTSNSGSAYYFDGTAGFEPYCFCSAGGPCLNTSDTAGCKNSTVHGSRIDVCGSTSVAQDDLILASGSAPANKPGLFFMGGAPLANTFLGDGHLCVASGGKGVYRFPIHNTGSLGELTEGPGIVALSHTRFASAGHIQAGDTWYFQCWYRDPLGPCGSGFNLSNAVAVTFAP